MKRVLFLTSFILLSCLGPKWTARPLPTHTFKRCKPMHPMPQMTPIPSFPGVWQVVNSCDEYPREKTSIALTIFLKEWRKVLGNDYRAMKGLSDLMIVWQDESANTHSGYSSIGIFHENVRIRGATMNDSLVIIYQDKNGPDRHTRICESALIHELIHIIIWKQTRKHGDPDHLGKKYLGWTADHSMIIQRTNESLCILGI